MHRRIDALRITACEDLDSGKELALSPDEKLEAAIDAAKEERVTAVSGTYGAAIAKLLDEIHQLDDFDLVRELTRHYSVSNFDNAGYSSANIVVSKVNHGFWEHLAYLHAAPAQYGSYRDVNLNLRIAQYKTGGFLDLLVPCIVDTVLDGGVSKFISCTTGVHTFDSTLGAPWMGLERPESYTLSPFKRGAARGLLAFARFAAGTYGIATPIAAYDSYSNNKSFEDGVLLSNVLSAMRPDAVALVVGPPRLSGLRFSGWKGDHAFLAISSNRAMAEWRFNLINLFAVLQYYSAKGKNVAIFFQGAVLGPVIASYLKVFRASLDIDVAFLDLGRLLDTVFEEDVTRTGSPLPNGSFGSGGQLELRTAGTAVFQEFPATAAVRTDDRPAAPA